MLADVAEIGGASNAGQDLVIKEIYQQYAESIEEFCSQVPDIFAIDSKEPFANLFFAFRAVIKVSWFIYINVANLYCKIWKPFYITDTSKKYSQHTVASYHCFPLISKIVVDYQTPVTW